MIALLQRLRAVRKSVLRAGYDRLWHKWPLMVWPLMRRARRKLGYWPNPFLPRSFNDKILWRMLFDRRAIYRQISGKFEARDFVRTRLPDDDILVPLVGMIRTPNDVHRMTFPDTFMLKINDGSQQRRVYKRGEPIDLAEMEALAKQWLSHNYGKYAREWSYRDIEHAIIVEEFLGADDGTYPDGLKFICFDGQVQIIFSVCYAVDPPQVDTYDRNWTPLDVEIPGNPRRGATPPPPILAEAIRMAETLSRGFDQMRVDFLIVDGKLRFNEFTSYCCAGLNEWARDFDIELGQAWKLPSGVGPLSALFWRQPDVLALHPTQSLHP